MKDLCLGTLDHDLYMLILTENANQLDKWGIQDHNPSDWLMFTMEELGELAEAIGDWKFRDGKASNVIKEAIQVATLSLKIAEMFLARKENVINETKTGTKNCEL